MTWIYDKNDIYGMDKELVVMCQRAQHGDAFKRMEAYQDANHGGATFMADFEQVRFAGFPEHHNSFETFKRCQHQITQS